MSKNEFDERVARAWKEAQERSDGPKFGEYGDICSAEMRQLQKNMPHRQWIEVIYRSANYVHLSISTALEIQREIILSLLDEPKQLG